jgi:hypothetical protein
MVSSPFAANAAKRRLLAVSGGTVDERDRSNAPPR